MSRALIEAPVSDAVRAAVASGHAAYQRAIEAHPQATDEWDKAAIDAVILAFARQGRPFSANDIRPHLPAGVRIKFISHRFRVAQRGPDAFLRYGGVTPSTLASTRSARVNVYIPIPGALR